MGPTGVDIPTCGLGAEIAIEADAITDVTDLDVPTPTTRSSTPIVTALPSKALRDAGKRAAHGNVLFLDTEPERTVLTNETTLLTRDGSSVHTHTFTAKVLAAQDI